MGFLKDIFNPPPPSTEHESARCVSSKTRVRADQLLMAIGLLKACTVRERVKVLCVTRNKHERT